MIRAGVAADLPAIERIQNSAEMAAHWPVEDYPPLLFLVAEENGEIAGFLVARGLGEDEYELLNLVVAAEKRRQGWGRRLLAELPAGRIFLEVRESNQIAIGLYEDAGFQRTGRRRGYYQHPTEDGIVMDLKR